MKKSTRALKRSAIAAMISAAVMAGIYFSLRRHGFLTHDELCMAFGGMMTQLWKIGLLFVLMFSLYPKIRPLIVTVAMFYIAAWLCDRPVDKRIWLTNFSDHNRSVVVDGRNYTVEKGSKRLLHFFKSDVKVGDRIVKKRGTYVVNLAYPQKYMIYAQVKDVAKYGHYYEAVPLRLAKSEIFRIDTEPDAWIQTDKQQPDGKSYYLKTVDAFNRRFVDRAKLYENGCNETFKDRAFCFSLALCYEEGYGVPLNLAKAARLYRESCQMGLSEACYNLALLYYEGLGVAQNRHRAVKLFERACKEGTMDACYNLGNFYHQGIGVESNATKAIFYLTKACQAGGGEACYNLAIIYGNGEGVKIDFSKAMQFLKKACDAGLYQGCQEYRSLKDE